MTKELKKTNEKLQPLFTSVIMVQDLKTSEVKKYKNKRELFDNHSGISLGISYMDITKDMLDNGFNTEFYFIKKFKKKSK